MRCKILAFSRERESKRRLVHTYDDIISFENLLISWQEFLRGKRKRKDVAEFSFNFLDNIYQLHEELKNGTYQHGRYEAFKVNDPKPRDIHKASVRDRLVHHAMYRILYPYFEKKFIHDSYSCRVGKGTHKAINRFQGYLRKVSKNNTKQCWVLKCDVKKFFASIDHQVLKYILIKYISDIQTRRLFENIIDSFSAGLPLGNLTSQLLVNIYMNEFDHFVKRELKVRYYIRYADDFVVLSDDKKYLGNLLPQLRGFLERQLKLTLHPNKVFIKTLASGVDFLGWVHFPHHRIPRTTTKRRMLRHTRQSQNKETVCSYLGLLSHGNTYNLRSTILSQKHL